MKALLREITLMAEPCADYEVISVFFGGGTPSLLSAGQLERILSVLKKNYDLASDAEITLECNPATASLDKLTAYRASGINRLSIGLQSANDRELKELGRIHNYRQFLQTYEDARNAGFTNINIDLMSALPGQTCESYEDTLQKVLSLESEHISAYSLIIEEGTPFYERYGEKEEEDGQPNAGGHEQNPFPPLPDEDEERRMYHRTNTLLKQAGFERYEISNYAKKGYECRHNLTYWTGVDYVGFGIGAASYFQGCRYKNTVDIKKYQELLLTDKKEKPRETEQSPAAIPLQGQVAANFLMRGQGPWHEEIQHLTLEEKMEEYMFLGLRLKKGVSQKEFKERFGKTVDEIYGTVIAKFVQEALLIRKNDRLYLSKKGTDVANYVMAEFLLDQTDSF